MIGTSNVSLSATCWTESERVSCAQAIVREARMMGALDRGERKALNGALFALGFPTLGASRTVAQYSRTLRGGERKAFLAL